MMLAHVRHPSFFWCKGRMQQKENSADAESQLEVYILFRFLVPVYSWLTAALVLIISLV